MFKLSGNNKTPKSQKVDISESVREELAENSAFVPIETAFDNAYKRYRINGVGESSTSKEKIDVNAFFEKIRQVMIDLIQRQLQELHSTKIQTTTWIKWRKEELSIINEEPDVILVNKAFNSNMTEVFQGSDLNEVLNEIFAHIKTQIENPKPPASEFTIDHILYLDIDFYKLKLTQGSSYIPLPSPIS